MVIARTTRSQTGAVLAAGFGLTALALSYADTAAANNKYAAYVIDISSNEVLLSDQAEAPRVPASVTKVMTLYLLFDALDRGQLTLDTRMPVSLSAARQGGTKLGLKRGESLRVEDAILGLLTRSANDAAVVVAEYLAGTESAFAVQMTAKARELGMSRTLFMNASGMPNATQRTTARDLATLGQAMYRDHQRYYSYFQTRTMWWRNKPINNHNRLLGNVRGVDGMKTGFTNLSGFNLLTSVERDGKRLIAVVMGGETSKARDEQVAHVIESAYEELNRRLGPAQAVYVSLPVTRLTVAIDPEGEEGPSATITSQTAPADRVSYTAPAPAMAPLTAAPAGALTPTAATQAAGAP